MNDTSQQLCCFRCCSVPNFNFNIEVNIIWALLESKVQSFLKLILQLLFSLNSVKQTETYTEVISPHFRSENKSYIDFIYHNEKNSNQKRYEPFRVGVLRVLLYHRRGAERRASVVRHSSQIVEGSSNNSDFYLCSLFRGLTGEMCISGMNRVPDAQDPLGSSVMTPPDT